jgi:hypothetical protein
VSGVSYWLERLRPLAAQGFRRGVVTPAAVILYDGDGQRVVLPRPRRWLGGSELDRAFEEAREEVDDEAAAAARALWQIEPSGGEG